jgi:hypothetical protein
MVTWQADGGTDFSAHPLTPDSSRGTAGNPIMTTSSGTSVTYAFGATGFFPFYCANHGSTTGSGESGVIQVVP